ncbi:penicillin-binding protein 1C [Coralliovum pocilloporae]|uniref:penicillin-binding protein 1C n=1 Tax=Coralliovum pocilloporae TaxID=3066369 RepID=UPI003306DF43
MVRFLKILVGLGGSITLVVMLALVSPGLGFLKELKASLPAVPDPGRLALSREVVDRDSHLLRAFQTPDGFWRLAVDKDKVDPVYLSYLMAYEDADFYRHSGVDYPALLRAALQYAWHGRPVSGGSTLTMQVARLLMKSSTRSLTGKAQQILFAWKLEAALSKEEILALYLHLAPFGGNVEGIRAASLAYLGKEPGRLTPAEAALLVALPQSPEQRRPDRFSDRLKVARDRVLHQVRDYGALGDDDLLAALKARAIRGRKAFPAYAPHLTERVAQQAGVSHRAPIRLHLERELQKRLEVYLSDVLPEREGLSGAVLVADIRTGAIRASVGSADYLDAERLGFVDMTRAIRSPGSALKPLIYGLAFDEGLAHPASLIEDRPTGFGSYQPVNFDGRYRGTVTVRDALTLSLNIPAVSVLDAVGPARMMTHMRKAGMTPVLPRGTHTGLAIGLGGVGVTLRDLVQLYAAIGNGGETIVLKDAPDGQQEGLSQNSVAPVAVLSENAAWYLSDILKDSPPPRGRKGGRIAFKTGTSYGYRDAWAIGFDGRTVIGVWVGRVDGAAVPSLSGLETAAPILFGAFDRLGADLEPLPGAPASVLISATDTLPQPLRHVRVRHGASAEAEPDPSFAFPPEGARLDISGQRAISLRVRDGRPPFFWFADGKPIGKTEFRRSFRWQADKGGFAELSVIDSRGRSAQISVVLQ